MDEKRCIIDLREMGDRYQLELVDVVRDGKVIMRDHAWTAEALRKAVEECKERAAGAEVVELRGHVPNWAVSAMAYAVKPAICHFEIGPGGIYKMDAHPFEVTTKEATCGMFFTVLEDEDGIYVQGQTDSPHADAHGFDLSKYEEITMPPIASGKNVYLSGETVNPIAVSMVLTYADSANAVFIRFHEEPNYVCCVTHDESIVIGAEKPVK
ncbi:MAG: hypothetical protein Q4B26_01255 [Eubacteriales bacterium]|nr:hypothetical protein [Eubacteriales bacterium]